MKKVVAVVIMLLLLAACGGGGGKKATPPKSVPLADLPHDVLIRGEFILGDLGIRPNIDSDVFAAVGVTTTTTTAKRTRGTGSTGGTGGTGSTGAIGGTGPATTTTTLPLIGAESIRGNLSDCAGAGAFSDLVTGAPVVVSDLGGKPVGIGKIYYGVATNTYQGHINQCTFRFLVGRLPHLTAYVFKIANQKPVPIAGYALLLNKGYVRFSAQR